MHILVITQQGAWRLYVSPWLNSPLFYFVEQYQLYPLCLTVIHVQVLCRYSVLVLMKITSSANSVSVGVNSSVAGLGGMWTWETREYSFSFMHIFLCVGLILCTNTRLVSHSQPHSPEQWNVFLHRTYAALHS